MPIPEKRSTDDPGGKEYMCGFIMRAAVEPQHATQEHYHIVLAATTRQRKKDTNSNFVIGIMRATVMVGQWVDPLAKWAGLSEGWR